MSLLTIPNIDFAKERFSQHQFLEHYEYPASFNVALLRLTNHSAQMFMRHLEDGNKAVLVESWAEMGLWHILRQKLSRSSDYIPMKVGNPLILIDLEKA